MGDFEGFGVIEARPEHREQTGSAENKNSSRQAVKPHKETWMSDEGSRERVGGATTAIRMEGHRC